MTPILVSGRIFALGMLIAMWIFIVSGMEMAKKKLPSFRRIAGLDALPEMVARANAFMMQLCELLGLKKSIRD